MSHLNFVSIGKRVGIELILHPLFIAFYLSIPRFYLVWEGRNFEDLFNTYYKELTLGVAILLTGLFYFGRFFSLKLSRLLIFILLHLILLIRIAAIIHETNFGFGFSPITFYHFEWTAVVIGVTEQWHTLLAFFLGTMFFLFLFIQYTNSSFFSSKVYPILALIFLLLMGRAVYFMDHWKRHPKNYFATYSFIYHAVSYYEQVHAFQNIKWSHEDEKVFKHLGISVHPPQIQHTTPLKKPLNLILVYLESFQSNFTEIGQSEYPELTPYLDQFIQTYTFVENYYNAVTPTINALISSQCGILPDLDNLRIKENPDYNAKLYCLSDFLHEVGYYQVYMQGASIYFSGKDQLLKTHQFDQVLGFEQLAEQSSLYHTQRHYWGIHDTNLITETLKVLESLQEKKPYHLSFLTVNTHHPGFISPGCPLFHTDNTMLNAIHCTDYAIGQFLNEVEKRGYLNDTVIMILGDHMLYPSKSNLKMLSPQTLSTYYGKTFMALHSPAHKLPRRIGTPIYTPDITPTLLELLNFEVKSFYFGQSLLSGRKKFQHLITSRFQILNGQQIIDDPMSFYKETCPTRKLLDTSLTVKDTPFTECERKKVIFLFNQRLIGKKGIIYPHSSTPGVQFYKR